VFVGPRFAEFEWQGEVMVTGRRRRADILHRRAGVAVELDGHRYHDADGAHVRDRQRDAEFAAAGLTTMRFTFEELRDRRNWCRDVVLRAVEARL
jgi:very-short-patch-repair endonuclease